MKGLIVLLTVAILDVLVYLAKKLIDKYIK